MEATCRGWSKSFCVAANEASPRNFTFAYVVVDGVTPEGACTAQATLLTTILIVVGSFVAGRALLHLTRTGHD